MHHFDWLKRHAERTPDKVAIVDAHTGRRYSYAQFSERVDWTTTLVVPVPSYASLSYTDVKVDGVVGTLVRSPRGSKNRHEYLLTWVKSDIVYALHGVGTVSDAVRIAESLQ